MLDKNKNKKGKIYLLLLILIILPLLVLNISLIKFGYTEESVDEFAVESINESSNIEGNSGGTLNDIIVLKNVVNSGSSNGGGSSHGERGGRSPINLGNSCDNGGVDSLDKECQDHGFDFGIKKYECGYTTPENGSHAGDYNTSVIWNNCVSVNWTSNPGVGGVLSKESCATYNFSGGTSGIVTKIDHDISHITFCGYNQTGYCGDNIINGNEECDLGELNGVVCEPPYDGNCTYCSDECKNITLYDGFCGDNIINGDEGCELPETNNNSFCCQTTKECLGNKLGTRDEFGYCDVGCGCVKDDFEYSCVKDECRAQCGSDEDCESNSCYESYDDYCQDKKLVDYNANGVSDSFEVQDDCENTCDLENDCSCSDCEVDCGAEPLTHCVKDVCGAECEFDIDCDDKNENTLDTCSECACEYEKLPYCGDGNLDLGEECDDGNNENGDGCNENCIIEGLCEEDEEQIDFLYESKPDSAYINESSEDVSDQLCADGFVSIDTSDGDTHYIYMNWDSIEVSEYEGAIYFDLLLYHKEDASLIKVQLKNQVGDWVDVCDPDESSSAVWDTCDLMPYLNILKEVSVIELRLVTWKAGTCHEYLGCAKLDAKLYECEKEEPYCGDGNLDDGEECDDGNDINGDGCDENCMIEFKCDQDSDCGEDGFIDNQFCVCTTNVWDWWVTYECVNPGQIDGYCINSSEIKLKEGCGSDYCDDWGDICYNNDVYEGRDCYDNGCKSGECFSNSYMQKEFVEDCGYDYCEYNWNYYCEGNDVYRERTCYDKGCEVGACFVNDYIEDELFSECSDECIEGRCYDIECYIDDDCPEDGYMGNEFCWCNKLFDYYIDYSCVEGGSVDSYCDSSTKLEIVGVCNGTYCTV